MSFPSYILCGLQSFSMLSDDGDDDGESHFSIMDFVSDLPLCCQDTEGMDAIFRPLTVEEPSGRETTDQQKMMAPWRPPLYRDKSLLSASTYPPGDDDSPSSVPPRIITPSVEIASCNKFFPSTDRCRSSQSTKNHGGDTNEKPLPADFIPPKHSFSRSFEAADKQHDRIAHITSRSVPVDRFKIPQKLGLRPQDVVCGRGAPSSIHPGNLSFKAIIKKHEMKYLCSKRSEKPKIATEVLGQFRETGIRFVKRERDEEGEFIWVEIGEQREYEKVCQSLREGAPQLRRQMMATEAAKLRSKTGGNQQCQDTDTKISSEMRTNDDTTTSRDSIVRHSSLTTNNDDVPEAERNSNNNSKIQRLYYDEKYGNKDCNIKDHYYSPYYVHLPPHRGGEILFRE